MSDIDILDRLSLLPTLTDRDEEVVVEAMDEIEHLRRVLELAHSMLELKNAEIERLKMALHRAERMIDELEERKFDG